MIQVALIPRIDSLFNLSCCSNQIGTIIAVYSLGLAPSTKESPYNVSEINKPFQRRRPILDVRPESLDK